MSRTICRIILASWLIVAAGPALGQPATQPVGKDLAVTLRPQETSLWCWAACVEMIVEFLDSSVDVKQCDEAVNEFGPNCCDPVIRANSCINGGWPRFDRHFFNATLTYNQALTWAQVRTEIDAGRPIAFTWKNLDSDGNLDGTSHMMVLTGYSEFDGVRYVSVLDPWPMPSDTDPGGRTEKAMRFEHYEQGANHVHGNDYYEIKK